MSSVQGFPSRPGSLTEADQLLLLFIHDIRAHVRAATMMSQLLERSIAASLTNDEESFFQRLVEAQRNQDLLLTKMAEYCRAADDLDRFGPVAVALLFDGAAQTIRSRTRNPIHVQADLPRALAAPQPLQKVFVELLDNAVKFNSGDIRVEVRSRVSESEWIFEFVDNGIGFDPAFAQVILEPLKRLHGSSAYPGFGLGLAIANRIVRGLDGRLWAEPVPGGGSKFAIALPTRRCRQ